MIVRRVSLLGCCAAVVLPVFACGPAGDRGVGDTTSAIVPATNAGDSSGRSLRIEAVRVNRGTSGMTAQVRWALSEDRTAVIAVEDAASVENEPLPNGVILARESANGVEHVQLDSVWDAAPSPDWRAMAFGRAHRVSAGERDSLTTAQWDSLARAAGMPVADVRRGAFPASGMAIIVGLAQPGLVRIGEQPRVWPSSVGWRVAWSRDGGRIAAGTPPSPRISDDADPARWVALDTGGGMPRGELPAEFERFEPVWIDGPLIDISAPVDTSPVRIEIEGGVVESAGNRITRNGVDVGPGVALAATRSGRAIVAMAPDPTAGEYDPKERLVVYLVRP